MRVHIVPCGDKYARKHHAKTIEKLVPREEIILFENDKKLTSRLKDDAYACWGVTNAKNNSNYKNWQTMQKDDICIMYRDKTFFSCGKITAKFKNKEFSKYLWGSKEDGQLWENMFLIDEIKEINVPLDVLKKVMGYKEKFFIQGYTTFDNISSEKIVAAFQIPFFEKSFNDTALKVEIERREKMWMEIQKIQNIRPLTAEEVRSKDAMEVLEGYGEILKIPLTSYHLGKVYVWVSVVEANMKMTLVKRQELMTIPKLK